MGVKIKDVTKIVKDPKVLNAKKWVKKEASKMATKVVKEILDSDVPLPNIPQQVKEDSKVWRTITEVDGLKLQQNVVSQHGRILDKDNIRIKWGSMEGMDKAFDRMIERMEKERKPVAEKIDEKELIKEKLKGYKEMYDAGLFTDEEFEEIRKKHVEMLMQLQ